MIFLIVNYSSFEPHTNLMPVLSRQISLKIDLKRLRHFATVFALH